MHFLVSMTVEFIESFFITYLTNDSAVMYRQWLGFNHGKPTGCCLACPGLPVKVNRGFNKKKIKIKFLPYFGTFEGKTSMATNGGHIGAAGGYS